MLYSDVNKRDRERHGDDLLARMDELTSPLDYRTDGDGWRWLLWAAAREIRWLRKRVPNVGGKRKPLNMREEALRQRLRQTETERALRAVEVETKRREARA